MRYFTKDEIDKLNQVHGDLYLASRQGWKRNTPKRLNEMVYALYNEAVGYKNVNYNCPKCVLDLYVACGQHYFNSLDELNRKIVENRNKGKRSDKNSNKLKDNNIKENGKKQG